jgi:flavin-dependent thymidylate synthase
MKLSDMEPNSHRWLREHRAGRPYYVAETDEGGAAWEDGVIFSRQHAEDMLLLADKAFNNHDRNGGNHVSPYDTGRVDVGRDNLEVRLLQEIDEDQLQRTLRRAIRATNGVDPSEPEEATDPEEMFKGGLQTALESQVIVFEVIGASRVLTHQLVRTRKAAFHQQSQRATWYGDRPNQRWPASIMKLNEDGQAGIVLAWEEALLASWHAYKVACDAGVSYQDARYILPEGTTNYILCEYSIREFIAMFAYRGCSMFQWEMVDCARKMRAALLRAHPFLEPYVKISCEKGALCWSCGGTGKFSYLNPASPDGAKEWVDGIARDSDCPVCLGNGSPDRKCTFQGWENVETQCDFPWAKQSNRVFLPAPRNRIG